MDPLPDIDTKLLFTKIEAGIPKCKINEVSIHTVPAGNADQKFLLIVFQSEWDTFDTDMEKIGDIIGISHNQIIILVSDKSDSCSVYTLADVLKILRRAVAIHVGRVCTYCTQTLKLFYNGSQE